MGSKQKTSVLARRDFLRLAGSIACVGGGTTLSGCGGGSGGPNSGSGQVTFQRSVIVTSLGGSIADPDSGFTVTIPTGAMLDAAKVEATVWSKQRSSVPRAHFDTSLRAFDVALNPSQFVGQESIILKLPWLAGADAVATMVVAFGTGGRSIVLRLAPGSTPGSPSALIGAAEFQYLLGAASAPNETVSIQVAVAEGKSDGRAVSAPPKLKILRTRPVTRTHYASRTRVAIVIHGILSSSAGLVDLTNLVSGNFPTDGDSGVSAGFDEIATFDYDWKQTIGSNGVAVAAMINSKWGDADKFEVHIFAHSMGGLVSRYAIEKVGTPSVTQLVTFGTPHLGVPLTVITNAVWYADDPLWLGLGFSLVTPGVRELLDDSAVIASLKGSSAGGVKYQAVAGNSHANFYSGLGEVTEVIYTRLNGHHIEHDGIVPEYSALGGPAKDTRINYLTHSTIVGQVITYWATVPSSQWIAGMNRKIATIEITPASVNFALKTVQNLSIKIFDKDHDEIDRALIPALQLNWVSADPSIVSVSSPQGAVTGVKVGGPIPVTVTEQTSGVHATVGVQVNTSEWTNPKDGSVLRWVPGGSFYVGSVHPNFPQEAPVHRVTLSGYWMCKYPVTVAQYKKFCTETGHAMAPAPYWGLVDSHSIVNVTWFDAVAYANWAGLVLPTEAQRELAANGGDGRAYPWGSEWDETLCNNSVTHDATGLNPVGSYPLGASPYGMLDMVGNVSEWSSDWYGPYTSGDQTNPTGPASGDVRALRGTAFVDNVPHFFRCTVRGQYPPSEKLLYIGFRLSLPG